MTLKRLCRATLVVLALFHLLRPDTAAAQLRAELVGQGFANPVGIVPDPTAANTLFIVEQGGTVRALVDGIVEAVPFLDLSAEVKFQTEQGLLGLALAADGERVFACWVKQRDPDLGIGDVVVSRFRRSANLLVVDRASRFDLVWPGGSPLIEQPAGVHKGGNLAFGPDGYLYLGLGDGGALFDPENGAQSLSVLRGKFLRIDIDVPDSDPRGYRVPADNPFVGKPIAALPEIWSVGHRNPWRWSFDDFGTGATGALIMGDVGQDTREEINYEPAGRGGRNYGWYLREGTIPTPGAPAHAPAYVPLTEPLVDYPRTIGRAVTGGYIYRGTSLHNAYRGRYFVADFYGGIYSLALAIDGGGEARVVDVLDHRQELGNPFFIATLGRGLDGELYFSSFIGGRVFKIVGDTSALPAAPENFTTSISGSKVSLAWQPPAGGAPVLGYQLEAGSESGGSDLLVTETQSQQLVVSGVPPGLYYVRVRASNSAGVGGPTAERIVRVGCAGTLPEATGLVSSVAHGVVSLSWSPVEEATGYLIEAGSGSGRSDLALIPVPGPGVSGAVPPGTYYVRVRAVTECGTTGSSNEVVVEVP